MDLPIQGTRIIRSAPVAHILHRLVPRVLPSQTQDLFDLLVVCLRRRIRLQRGHDRLETDVGHLFDVGRLATNPAALRLGSQQPHVCRVLAFHRLGKDECHSHAQLVQRFRQAVTGRAKAPADERREFPAQHENANARPLIVQFHMSSLVQSLLQLPGTPAHADETRPTHTTVTSTTVTTNQSIGSHQPNLDFRA